MPRGDRTGPDGYGPMTGRAAGYCAGYDRPGFANPIANNYGRGMANRFGRRGGYGRFAGFRGAGYAPPAYYPAPYNPDSSQTQADELGFLKNQAEILKRELDNVNKRISDLGEDKEEKNSKKS